MEFNKILHEQGIKKIWLADRLGVSPQTINNWVQGKSYPREKHMNILLKLLRRKSPLHLFGKNKSRSDKGYVRG